MYTSCFGIVDHGVAMSLLASSGWYQECWSVGKQPAVNGDCSGCPKFVQDRRPEISWLMNITGQSRLAYGFSTVNSLLCPSTGTMIIFLITLN